MAAYGMGALQAAVDAGLRRIFIVSRDDLASREAAEALRSAAAAQKLELSPIEVYRPGTLDYAPRWRMRAPRRPRRGSPSATCATRRRW
jgi:ABC-type branched-subunit amino acid transport system substrate-binding protein